MGIKEKCMSYVDFPNKRHRLAELKRLASFIRFPHFHFMPVVLLANWGFAYNGDGTNDQVKCTGCGRVQGNWESANLDCDLHNPRCSFEGTHKDKKGDFSGCATGSADSLFPQFTSGSFQSDTSPAIGVDCVDRAVDPDIADAKNSCCSSSAGFVGCVGERNETRSGTVTTGEKEIENSGSLMIVNVAAGQASDLHEKYEGLRHKDHEGARWGVNVQQSRESTNEEFDLSQQQKAGAEATVVVGTEATGQEDMKDIEDTGQKDLDDKEDTGHNNIQRNNETGHEAAEGILVDANSEFILCEKRMESVSACPDANLLCVEQAASAGLYFSRVKGRFFCFSCELVIHPHQVDENISDTHWTLSSSCAYMRLLRESYVGLMENFRYLRHAIFTGQTYLINPGVTAGQQATSTLSIKYTFLFNTISSIIAAIAPTGCPVVIILDQIERTIKSGFPLKALTVLRGLVCYGHIRLSVQNQDVLMNHMVESDAQRSKLMCKVCTRHEIQIVFLQCGHAVVCSYCDALCVRCPICSCDIVERMSFKIPSCTQ